MTRKKIRLNSKEESVWSVSHLFNVIALIICWLAVIWGVVRFMITNQLLPSLLFLEIVPFRYFFFDLSPDRLSRRPPELDRSIPLTIFIHYWMIRFPIPQGGFLADIAGFFLANCRAVINGYGLLMFDTFAFMFRIRNDSNGLPLDQEIKVIHHNKKLDQIAKAAHVSTNEEEVKEYNRLYNAWKQTEVTSELNKFDIPIRRYLDPQEQYFINQELDMIPIDDQFSLNQEQFLKAHPDQKNYFKILQNQKLKK